MRTRYGLHNKEREPITFITSAIVGWVPIFTHGDHLKIMADTLNFCVNNKGLKVYAYVIMENHIHLVASSPNLPETMKSLKGFTAKKLIESVSEKGINWMLDQFSHHKARHKRQSHYQVWQEGYHPKEIMGSNMFRQKIEYIHYNPVRRGYVIRSEHWRYSSAGELLTGIPGVVTLCPMPVL